MDNEIARLKHKEWRKIAKKERRRKFRQKIAQKRDAERNRLQEELEKDPEYLKKLKEQEEQEKFRQIQEEKEHAEREKQWLKEEDKSQKEWQENQERKEKARQIQREQEDIVRKEYDERREALEQKRREEKRRFEEEMKKQKEFEQQLDDYIDHGAKTPENMRTFKETNPGKELCPFFDKTNACRYGDNCSRNHRKIGLSKVILIPHFYSHFSLEKNAAEYDTDINLEYDLNETRRHFREFYKDIVPELENFGRIKTLRVCCNSQFHLRGNVYVEYYSERYAAHAVRNLKGRWYGGRQLNCEFANIQSWRHAICGLKRNCPKGKRTCNFLHTFRNPDDEYAVKSPPKYVKSMYGYTAKTENCNRSERRTRSKWGDTQRFSEDEDTHNDNRSWRWSESPDREQDNYQRNDNRNYNYRNNRNYYPRYNRRNDYNDRSRSPSSASSKGSSTPERRKRSTSRRRSRHRYKRSRNYDYYSDDDDDNYRRRKNHRSRSSRHRNYRSDHRSRKRTRRDHRSRRRGTSYSDKDESEDEKRSRDSRNNEDNNDSYKDSEKEKTQEKVTEKSVKKETSPVFKVMQNQIASNEMQKVEKESSEEDSSSGSNSSSDDSSDDTEESQPEQQVTLINKETHCQTQLESVPVQPKFIPIEREYEWDTTESESEAVKK